MKRNPRSGYRALVSAALALVACGAPNGTPEPVGETHSAITNGVSDPFDNPVGAIQFNGPNGPAITCTGTLITPDVVLTSSPCIFDDSGNIIAADSLLFMTGQGVPQSNQAQPPAGLTPHTVVQTLNGSQGWALLRMSPPVASITPASLGTGTAPTVGMSLRVVGFGLAETDGKSGDRQSATVDVETVGSSYFWVGDLPSSSGAISVPYFLVGTLIGISDGSLDENLPRRLDQDIAAIQGGIEAWPQTQLGATLPLQVGSGYVAVPRGPDGVTVHVGASPVGWSTPSSGAVVAISVDAPTTPGLGATFVQTAGASLPDLGVQGTISVTADDTVPVGTQYTATARATDGTMSVQTTFEIIVDGCSPHPICPLPNTDCGTVSDGCGGTYICGCNQGYECSSAGLCEVPSSGPGKPQCKPPKHLCGGNTCLDSCP